MSWFGGKKKQKKKEYSGFQGDCSEQQMQTLQKFKKHVYEIHKISPQKYDEVYLLRFLRARKFDFSKTSKMWDDYIQWRVKNDIDNCWKFQFPELPQLRKMYPHGYHKVDKLVSPLIIKQFRPIYIERAGLIDVEKIFKVMKTQNMLNYYAMLYETLLSAIFDGCTKAKAQATGQNSRVCQTITILDLKNVKLGNISKAYDFLKPVTAMAQDNYPEILGNMFIINAPMLFTGIWAIVKMWIDQKTKEKIKILGSSYKKQLLECIDPQNLPAFLDGGKCMCGGKECILEANVGPWNPEGKQMFETNINPKVHQLKKEEQKISSVAVNLESKPQQLKDATQTEEILERKQQEVSDGTQTEQVKEQTKELETHAQTVEEGTQTEQTAIVKTQEKQLDKKEQNLKFEDVREAQLQTKKQNKEEVVQQKVSEQAKPQILSPATASTTEPQGTQSA